MNQEAGHLHLANGVEGHETDVGIRESDSALADLGQDLGAIGAAKHGELPHGPVAVVKVVDRDGAHATGAVGADVGRVGGRELEARGPAVADDVVHLLGDLLVREGGQVGEGLEELQEGWDVRIRCRRSERKTTTTKISRIQEEATKSAMQH